MNTIEIFDIAEKNNVDIVYTKLPHTNCISLKSSSDQYYIGIDPEQIKSVADERVKIAHDLGHCMTDSFYNLKSPLDVRGKHEYKANAWAIKKLIPINELIMVMRQGYESIWELTEYFDVTDNFMRLALEYYENDFLEDLIRNGGSYDYAD